MRLSAALLLIAQLGVVTGPVLHVRPGDPSASGMDAVTATAGAITADAPGECQHCDMAECHTMLGCAAHSAALVEAALLEIAIPLVWATPVGWMPSARSLSTPPISPPPRA